ncbi:MAG: hypothetical protein LC708_00480, partial [Actinobacteria bacterium]|nr:hypothetical protein [Actinomycetota bacterium]
DACVPGVRSEVAVVDGGVRVLLRVQHPDEDVDELLEAVFGDAAVRSLAASARDDLRIRADRLLRSEEVRFAELVSAQAPSEGAAAELRGGLSALKQARQ